jgi:hypothetical protein
MRLFANVTPSLPPPPSGGMAEIVQALIEQRRARAAAEIQLPIQLSLGDESGGGGSCWGGGHGLPSGGVGCGGDMIQMPPLEMPCGGGDGGGARDSAQRVAQTQPSAVTGGQPRQCHASPAASASWTAGVAQQQHQPVLHTWEQSNANPCCIQVCIDQLQAQIQEQAKLAASTAEVVQAMIKQRQAPPAETPPPPASSVWGDWGNESGGGLGGGHVFSIGGVGCGRDTIQMQPLEKPCAGGGSWARDSAQRVAQDAEMELSKFTPSVEQQEGLGGGHGFPIGGCGGDMINMQPKEKVCGGVLAEAQSNVVLLEPKRRHRKGAKNVVKKDKSKRSKLSWYPPGKLQVYSRKGRPLDQSVSWIIPDSGFGFHSSDSTEVHSSLRSVLSSRRLNSQCTLKYCDGPHANRSIIEARNLDRAIMDVCLEDLF